MRLFDLIYQACVEKDQRALWELLMEYQPLINSNSKAPYSNKIDEDLLSEQYLVLARRIKNFDIFAQR